MTSMIYFLRLASLIFVALALVPAGSHLFSLANKMRLDRNAYLDAQLPEQWTALRTTWEYSHAASAILTFLAFLLLIVASIRA